jgi:hypothetical protein
VFVSPLPEPGPLILKQIPVHYLEGGERELAAPGGRAFGEGHEHAGTGDLGPAARAQPALHTVTFARLIGLQGGDRSPPTAASR